MSGLVLTVTASLAWLLGLRVGMWVERGPPTAPKDAASPDQASARWVSANKVSWLQ